MGNSGSAADRALKASGGNDVAGLQKVLDAMPDASPLRKLVLDAVDKEGRSCLIIATVKNYPRIIRLLLQNGADAHYINLKSSKCNTALHEAASRGYDEAVELLLQYGANPFLANSLGETPMELAVLSNSPKIVRTFEQKALFSGVAEFQWTKLLGLSLDFSARRVVIMDHFPFPSARANAPAQAARRQLWIHSSEKDTIMPKCRVWLDGAVAIRCSSGNECVLRLAHTHSQPVGKIYTRFAQGFCLFMRPAAPAPAGGRRASEPGREAWERMLRLCNVSDSLYVASLEPFFKGACGSAAPQGLFLARAPAAPAPAPFAVGPPGRSPSAAPSSAGPGSFAITPRSYPDLVNGVLMMPSPGTGVMPRDSFNWRAGSMQQTPPAPASSFAGSANTTPHRPPAPAPFSAGSHGRSVGGALDVDLSAALPGESDGDFAARLAAMSSGGAASAVDMQALKMASAALTRPPGYPAASSSSAPWPPSPPRHATSHLGFDSQPSAPPLLAPPTPTPAPAPPAQAQPPRAQEEADDSCVVCLSAPREAGFLHGGTVHRCVCNECSKIFQADLAKGEMPCPLCRQPVEQVIAIF